MATAKKLKSGSWRCLVYSHTEKIKLSDGSFKEKRIYESFTSDNPTQTGKREAEYMAAQFALEKERRNQSNHNYTLGEAIDEYIKMSDAVLSPTTLRSYKAIKKYSFQDLMDVPLKKLTNEKLKKAVNIESKRKPVRKKTGTISPKTVCNNYGLLTAAIKTFYPELNTEVKLPSKENKIKELLPVEVIYDMVVGTELELPVLLSMWLSLTVSEIRGLRKSTSISDGYLIVKEVVVDVGKDRVRKKQAKTFTRTRKHKIPNYIQLLIDQTNPEIDDLVPLSGATLYQRFTSMLEENNLNHMTFHDLRHLNASVMHKLGIPEKYAMERGGWKTETVMKRVYTHTFSDGREEADEIIDDYFNQKIMQHKMQHGTEKTL